jgi:hypothetical protein
VTKPLRRIFEEIAASWSERLALSIPLSRQAAIQ